MTKVKYFKTKPDHVEAMQFGGKNAKDVAEWIQGYALDYNLTIKNGGRYIDIQYLGGSKLYWRITKYDWVVHSPSDKYFYVEPSHIMVERYIED
jgi:hypothetical protein